MLPPGSWYRPGVVPDPDALLARLLAEVPWTDQMASRRTASMGVPYNYRSASYPVAPWHPAVAALAAELAPTLGFEPSNCLLNLYPTGRHALGWHADDTNILEPGTGIGIVSLGAARPLSLRAGEEPDFTYLDVQLEPGSLVFLSNAMQADWRHRLRRHPTTEPRLSLSFRRIVRWNDDGTPWAPPG